MFIADVHTASGISSQARLERIHARSSRRRSLPFIPTVHFMKLKHLSHEPGHPQYLSERTATTFVATVPSKHTNTNRLRSFDHQFAKPYNFVHQPHRTLDSAYPEGLHYHSSVTPRFLYTRAPAASRKLVHISLQTRIRKPVPMTNRTRASSRRTCMTIDQYSGPICIQCPVYASIEPTQDNRIVSRHSSQQSQPP